jgi:hypothetical protein
MKITITDNEGHVVLSVTSDGNARYKVRGKALRDNVGRYTTDDDLHVMGLVASQMQAYNSTEYLRRRLAEHEREVT